MDVFAVVRAGILICLAQIEQHFSLLCLRKLQRGVCMAPQFHTPISFSRKSHAVTLTQI